MADYILFDLDGTLTDPKEGITKCVQYALSRFGIASECDALVPFIGPPLLDSFRDFYHMTDEQAQQAVAYYRERFAPVGIFENGVYPGIPALLGALRGAGRRLAIATSKPTVYSVQICDKFGLSEHFEAIVGSELDGRRTDKAEVVSEALRQLGAKPGNAIMVGDRSYDILGAHRCGVRAVGVSYGYAAPGELERAGADAIADSPAALAPILLK